VGILNSSLYSSLHPGYWVVFSGIYASSSRADAAAQAAKEKGFAAAYSRQITR
jgi:ribosomal protein L11 methylase PrmA